MPHRAPDTATLPARSAPQQAEARLPLWQVAHALSLEAPIVAVIWAAVLARLHAIDWLPGVLPGLALSVWVIYLVDRTLDAASADPRDLPPRKRIYQRWRPLWIGLIIPAAIGVLIWLGLWVVPAGLMWQSIAIVLLVAIYLAVYAARRGPFRVALLYVGSLGLLVLLNAVGLDPVFKLAVATLAIAALGLLMFKTLHRKVLGMVSKEFAAGVLFALGCTAWVRFVSIGSEPLGSLLELLLLIALFTCNLTGITAYEAEVEAETEGALPSAPKPGRGHAPFLGFVSLFCLAIIVGGRSRAVPERLVPLAWLVGIVIVLLAVLHYRRRALSIDAYRVLADLAVFAPGAVFLLLNQAATTPAQVAAACCP